MEYKTQSQWYRTVMGRIALFWWALGMAQAGIACDNWMAKVVSVEGSVERQVQPPDWNPLAVDTLICPGERVRVGANSRAALYLRNNTFVRLDANSLVHFPERSSADNFLIELSEGIAHFISRIVNRFEVATPYVNAVVEGTEFIVSAGAQDAVTVVEGKVKTYNAKSTEYVTANQKVSATAADQPLQRFELPAVNQVEWAIFYPPVLTLSQLHPAGPNDKSALDQAIHYSLQNRPDLALQVLDGASGDASIQLAKAALLLAVGQVDTFDNAVEPLLQTDMAALGYSLKAVAAAARNRPAIALDAARKAVELAPERASTHIAQSYAQQAALQQDAALASAEKATKVEPDNALGWLRLSDLRLIRGDTRAAGAALDHAGSDPMVAARLDDARGFVALFSLHFNQAEQLFRAALKRESGNPQHHLGLGLALLRQGELAQGRRELEYAVSLDPLRSTLRSYLGRAYFEEKRDKEAIKQWDLAKQLDPNDPTPYFYTGVYKLFANDPVGAIEELETSRQLNDKRAVYRSETLLQSDAASRSATLARAYNEVGYDQGVLLNGWDAIRRDPTNSEGHRLLADKYANDPRYENARVSELLQSQLWQPLSAYPLQPQLSETNLVAVAGAGPQKPGFNEYHSLFTQDGVYGMVNGYGGSDGTWGDDLVGSILAGPVALSLGQFHYESNGWRDNADQEQDIYGGLFQAQLSPSTRIQVEHRYVNWEKGDLTPQWDGKQTTTPYDNMKRITNRFGLTQDLTSNDTLVFSALGQRIENEQAQNQGQAVGTVSQNQEPKTFEAQIVSMRHGYHYLYGGGNTRIEVSSQLNSVFSQSLGGVPETLLTIDVNDDNEFVQHQRSLYGYLYADITPSIDAVLGLSYDHLVYTGTQLENTVATTSIPAFDLIIDQQASSDINSLDNSAHQWSPKLGLSFKAWNYVQLRLAAFRAFSHSFAAGQTIEPVSIVGFSQYYDDRDGLQSDNYAIGWDFDHGADYAFGVSWVRRMLNGPVISNVANTETKSSESLVDAYFRSSPVRWMAYSTGYRYAELRDSYFSGVTDGVPHAKNYSIPLEVRFFPDTAVSLKVRETFYKQDFQYSNGVGALLHNSDSAFVTDVGVEYRFGKRLGLLSAGVQNAFDKDTEIAVFREQGISYLGFYPGRMLYMKFNFNL